MPLIIAIFVGLIFVTMIVTEVQEATADPPTPVVVSADERLASSWGPLSEREKLGLCANGAMDYAEYGQGLSGEYVTAVEAQDFLRTECYVRRTS